MPVIDFTEPTWLLNYYHVIGPISIFLNSFGIYLLLFQCKKLESFRYYLLMYQIACFVTDVHSTLLMQIVAFFPLFAGYSCGILWNFLRISTHFSVVSCKCINLKFFFRFKQAYFCFVAFQFEMLTVCFVKKHQAMAMIVKTHVFPNYVGYLAWVFCILKFPIEEQFKFIEKVS